MAPPSTLTTSARQTEVLRDSDHDRRESLVDLDALDISGFPTGAVERLAHGRDRTETEHAWLNRADAVGDEARHRFEAFLLGPGAVGHDHGRGPGIEARRIAGRDGAVLAERWLEL